MMIKIQDVLATLRKLLNQSFNLLRILGKRYILPKQLVFLKLYEKLLSSFSLINLILYNRLKNLLSFFESCDSN